MKLYLLTSDGGEDMQDNQFRAYLATSDKQLMYGHAIKVLNTVGIICGEPDDAKPLDMLNRWLKAKRHKNVAIFDQDASYCYRITQVELK